MMEVIQKEHKSKGGSGNSSLEAMILQRADARGKNFLDQLEAKYSNAETEKKRRKVSKK